MALITHKFYATDAKESANPVSVEIEMIPEDASVIISIGNDDADHSDWAIVELSSEDTKELIGFFTRTRNG